MLRRLILLAAGVVVVVACSKTEEPAPAAAAEPRSESAAPAQPSAGPPRPAADAVVAELYKRHAAGDTPFFQTGSREKVDAYFERTLADLIWKDAVESNGEVGALGFDPLYNAQDVEIKNLVVHPAQAEGGAARVVVSFENGGTPERLTYTVVPVANEWRISDVDYGGGTTLRGILTVPAGGS